MASSASLLQVCSPGQATAGEAGTSLLHPRQLNQNLHTGAHEVALTKPPGGSDAPGSFGSPLLQKWFSNFRGTRTTWRLG